MKNYLINNTIKYTQGIILASLIEDLLEDNREVDNYTTKLYEMAFSNIKENDISSPFNEYIYNFRVKLPYHDKDALYMYGLVLKSIFKNYKEEEKGKGFDKVVFLMNRISEIAISNCKDMKKPTRKKLQFISNYLNKNIIK